VASISVLNARFNSQEARGAVLRWNLTVGRLSKTVDALQFFVKGGQQEHKL
jgi:hypothetical protein